MIKGDIDKDLKNAMLSGNKRLVEVLRTLKSAILYKEVADGKRDTGIDDTEIVKVLKKEQKSRKEAVELYLKAGASDKADEEQYQISVIDKYLPEEISVEKITSIVQQAVNELNISNISQKDMGAIIGYVKKSEPNADGSIIASVVKNIIN